MHIAEAAARSTAGPHRALNEDAVLWLPEVSLLAVVDGMGGPNAGDKAAELAVALTYGRRDAVARRIVALGDASRSEVRLGMGQALERLFVDVHRRIRTDGTRLGAVNMGAAMGVVVVAADRAFLAHIGNTRSYLYRNGTLRQLTEDHTVAWRRFRHGEIGRTDAAASPERFHLTQALGRGIHLDVDTAEVQLADGDLVLVCSDGIHGVLDEPSIARWLARATCAQSVDKLIDAAIAAGSRDNLSVALARIEGDQRVEEIERTSKILEDLFLFAPLEDPERRMVVPYLDERRVSAGEVLFSEGDAADALYVVIDGRVRITTGDTTLVDIGPGGHFGELCLAREAVRSATVTALEDTRLFALQASRYREVVAHRPRVGSTLSIAMVDWLGGRLRDLTHRINTVERIARHGAPPGLDLATAVQLAARGELDDG